MARAYDHCPATADRDCSRSGDPGAVDRGDELSGADERVVAPATTEGPQRYATPLQIATRSWDSLVPQHDHGLRHADRGDLSELALEMLFPADPATIAIVKAMVEEEAAQAIESGLQKAS